MWYILGNHSRIVLSKLCPKTKQFPSFVSRNIRQNAKPGINKPVIQGEFLQAPTWSDLIKPAIFTGVFGTSVMTGAFIWKYENSRKKEQKFLDPVIKYFSNLPPPPKAGEWRRQLNEFWNKLHEGHKLTFGIFSINLAVFLLWRIPAARPFMTKYFASNPAVKKNCLPMLLCAFSHMGPLHFGFNMFALSSFAPPLVDIMGKEHFLGAYLTGAVVSSFTSYFYRVVTGTAGMSIGASGALFTILGIYGTLMPESEWSIIFLPMYSFTAENGIKGLLLFDLVGMVVRWGVLDHAAHIGGMFFGIWWITEGYKLVKPVVKLWHEEIRDKLTEILKRR